MNCTGMSRTEKRNAKIADTKEYIYERDEGMCANCGRQVKYPGQIAHLIPQGYARIYGDKVVQHTLNMRLVCGLKCNNALQLTNQPVAIAALAQEIGQAIGETVPERKAYWSPA